MKVSPRSRPNEQPASEAVEACYHLYRSLDQWYWRLVAADNRIIASSVEGFRTQDECLRAIDRVRRCGGVAPVLNVVYLDRLGDAPLSPHEAERLVDGLRRALGVPAAGSCASKRQA